MTNPSLILYRLSVVPRDEPDADAEFIDVWESPPPRSWVATAAHFEKHVPKGYGLVGVERAGNNLDGDVTYIGQVAPAAPGILRTKFDPSVFDDLPEQPTAAERSEAGRFIAFLARTRSV